MTFAVISPAKSAVVINSYNGLRVDSGELNDIGSSVDVADYSYSQSPGTSRKSVVFEAADPYTININSFQGNMGGTNSFRNNAGISLVPVKVVAADSGSLRAREMVSLSVKLIFLFIVFVN